MFREDFQELSKMRMRDARQLLAGGQHCAAYYLTGHAVECAIKACIAKQTKPNAFPARDTKVCYSHDLTGLIKYAGLSQKLSEQCNAEAQFDTYWAVTKDWKVDVRYRHDLTKTQARKLYKAVSARRYGVMAWLKNHW